MNNYTIVIVISSDEKNSKYSTPINTLPGNMVGRLDLSDSSVEAWRGSEADLSSTSASTFETLDSPKKVNFARKENDQEGASTVEQSPMDKDIQKKKNMRSRSALVKYSHYSRHQN